MTVVARRDGGLETMELLGMLTLRIADEAFGKIKLQLKNATNENVQLQSHPNIDKDLLRKKMQIALKNPAKPFPLNTDVGVLKWRMQTTDESNVPLSSECCCFSYYCSCSPPTAEYAKSLKVSVCVFFCGRKRPVMEFLFINRRSRALMV